MSARKPHNDWAGYRCELRNPYTGGHTVVVDCKLAEQQGSPWVEDYVDEGGRYFVLCNDHGSQVHVTSMPTARSCMKAPASFCEQCQVIHDAKMAERKAEADAEWAAGGINHAERQAIHLWLDDKIAWVDVPLVAQAWLKHRKLVQL